MTHEAQDDLRLFLATFDVTNLGEGDPNAGANTLAAMALALANVSRPRSGILTKEGHPFRRSPRCHETGVKTSTGAGARTGFRQ